MALRKLKPVSNARRGTSYLDNSLISKDKAPKSLRAVLQKRSGRNNTGKITVAHRGGGSKRFYRLVNFDFRNGKKAKVLAIEYDPNRRANVARIQYDDGGEDYILAADKLKVGASVESGQNVPIKAGNRTRVGNIPVGTPIHNIELLPGLGGQLCRSEGNWATLLGAKSGFAQIKLPSREVRKIKDECFASIGAIGNADVMNISFGKAGRIRHKGIRPTVRGKAKNAVDHPHGGGEGGTSIGLPMPKTPWGVPTLGFRTRNRKKKSGKFIIKRRS